MVKRMIMNLGASPPVIRVSIPGVEVTTSTPDTQLLLDERVLYGQIFTSGLATRLFPDQHGETLIVNIPSQGFIPFVNVWSVHRHNNIVYPASSDSQQQPDFVQWTQNLTQIAFLFSDEGVTAVYYQVLRLPRT